MDGFVELPDISNKYPEYSIQNRTIIDGFFIMETNNQIYDW